MLRSPTGLILALALLGSPLACGQGEGGAGSPSAAQVSSSAAREAVARGALLLDVRTPKEFEGGHLDGAKNIPVDDLRARLAELGDAKEIVVYCRSGRRSGIAAQLLAETGRKVLDLGPMSRW